MIISSVFPVHKEPEAMEMMMKIAELEAQNEELTVANERLMKKLNECFLQLPFKSRK